MVLPSISRRNREQTGFPNRLELRLISNIPRNQSSSNTLDHYSRIPVPVAPTAPPPAPKSEFTLDPTFSNDAGRKGRRGTSPLRKKKWSSSQVKTGEFISSTSNSVSGRPSNWQYCERYSSFAGEMYVQAVLGCFSLHVGALRTCGWSRTGTG